MNGNLLFFISLLISIIVHTSLSFGVQHLYFSSAQVPLKSGDVSRELAIHIMFKDPQPTAENIERAQNVSKLNNKEAKSEKVVKPSITKQEIKENVLQVVKQDNYILMPDDEPVPRKVQEEIVAETKPELKTVSDRAFTQNVVNPSGMEQQVVVPHTEKVQNVIVDLQSQKSSSQTYEKISHAENGVLAHTKPGYIKNPPPKYPRLARKLEYTGKVILRVEVKFDGNCGRVELVRSSGYSMLDNAATKAVKEWKFTPAKKWGKAVTSFTEITVNFQLE